MPKFAGKINSLIGLLFLKSNSKIPLKLLKLLYNLSTMGNLHLIGGYKTFVKKRDQIIGKLHAAKCHEDKMKFDIDIPEPGLPS